MWGYNFDDTTREIKELLFNSINKDIKKMEKTNSYFRRWIILKEIEIKKGILITSK